MRDHMLKLVYLSVLLCLLPASASSAEDKQGFTIYLIRHAEKLPDTKNPALTQCGLTRAESIAQQLQLINIEMLYSTNYKRTQQTAAPTSTSKQLSVISYDPANLPAFAKSLLAAKKNALVVGHSNTTAVLAGLLAEQPLTSFDESIYDRIYQVVFIDGGAQLNIFQQNFTCE
ncbi:SixA phosphatase family protein [Thalassotalea sp. ND16A]|uniref:SixA phosphatase family protein n=1 Tax=Thalassotalea sp. ND16A TaxID=1535422 RepID=UPI00051D88F4|nr:phosphoglycerate mutase family protein [Thalassotalea sp. ND16A]KGJ93456.1 hypothetical protein ND16A_1501 [Thalassotalea sp. ND16A]